MGSTARLRDKGDGDRVHVVNERRVRGRAVQEIFARSLEELDPCNLLSDHDIWTAIENAGARCCLLLLGVGWRLEAPKGTLLHCNFSKPGLADNVVLCWRGA